MRQAKLSFPSVHLLIGVCSDELCRAHKSLPAMTHAERCASVKHCRWVDEVVPDAPWEITQEFIDRYEIDYVAHDEEPYTSAGKEDVYDFVKKQGQWPGRSTTRSCSVLALTVSFSPLLATGRFLPTRRTPGISTSELLERIVSQYRAGVFDGKLEKVGLAFHPPLQSLYCRHANEHVSCLVDRPRRAQGRPGPVGLGDQLALSSTVPKGAVERPTTMPTMRHIHESRLFSALLVLRTGCSIFRRLRVDRGERWRKQQRASCVSESGAKGVGVRLAPTARRALVDLSFDHPSQTIPSSEVHHSKPVSCRQEEQIPAIPRNSQSSTASPGRRRAPASAQSTTSPSARRTAQLSGTQPHGRATDRSTLPRHRDPEHRWNPWNGCD
jgi:glycerol-3-phosphate cytidylyltransferase-like family protein